MLQSIKIYFGNSILVHSKIKTFLRVTRITRIDKIDVRISQFRQNMKFSSFSFIGITKRLN